MIKEDKINLVMIAFFDAIKPDKDYEIESTGLSYFSTLELIQKSATDAIKKNPDKFEILVNWFVSASMYLLDDIDQLDEIDLQLRNAQ
tara:strand:- start:3698 stop:3961 length:264 start_codon:yes stop_codon:yes gene_type:complete